MSELLYRVIARPAEESDGHLLAALDDAVLWTGGKVFVRLIEEPEMVYEIEGEVPVGVDDARRMIFVWKERNP